MKATSTSSSSRSRSSRTRRGGNNNNSDDSNNGKSCCSSCCLLWTVLVLGLLLIGGGVAWYLIPQDRKDDLPSLGGNLRKTTAPTLSPAPTMAPTLPFAFMQCDDNNDNDNNCCQGLNVGTCDLRVDELVYGYMHNAVHTAEDGFFIALNHEYGLEKALQAGFRAFELDVGRCNQDIVFYHSQCTLGNRNPTETLQAMGDFLDQHSSELIFLFLQMPDANDVSLAEFDQILQGVPTIANRLYAHTAVGIPWPTLGEMIAADERVVLFYWNQPNCHDGSNAAAEACPSQAWHYWFTYGIETDWDFRSVNAIDDTETSCAKRYNVVAPREFFRVNSFVTLPNRRASQTLNSFQYAQERSTACATLQNQAVNFYAVDYWSEGQVPQWIQETNRQRAAAAAQNRRRRRQV